MGVAQVEQPGLESLARVRGHAGVAERLGGDRLDGSERVVDPMMQLLDQEIALLLGALAIGDVAKHDTHAVAERKQPVSQPTAADDDRWGLGLDGLPALHRFQEQLPKGGLASAGEYLPERAADHLVRIAGEMARRLAVEAADAPLAVHGIEALTDPLEDGCELGFQV